MKSGAGAFDVDDFVARLATFMGGRKGVPNLDDSDSDAEEDFSNELLDWGRIGRRALAKSHRVPVMDFMYVLHLSPFCSFAIHVSAG